MFQQPKKEFGTKTVSSPARHVCVTSPAAVNIKAFVSHVIAVANWHFLGSCKQGDKWNVKIAMYFDGQLLYLMFCVCLFARKYEEMSVTTRHFTGKERIILRSRQCWVQHSFSFSVWRIETAQGTIKFKLIDCPLFSAHQLISDRAMCCLSQHGKPFSVSKGQ